MTEPSLPRRALVIGANYWPEESGSAPYTIGLAEDLAAHGVATTVLAAVPHYPQWEVREGYRGHLRVREWRNGVEVIHSWLWVPKRQSAAQRAMWEASFLLNALSVSGLQRPDVVIASTPSLSGAVAARAFARRWRVPYLLVVQDLVGPGAAQSGISGGAGVAGVVSRVEGWALARATRVVIVSEGFREYLSGIGVGDERIEHLPNWCDIEPSDLDPGEARLRFGLPDSPIVLHAGAMGSKQGLEQIVDAARLGHERNSGLCFVLAGDGSRRRELEERARGLPNLVFLPQQPREDYADLLAAADVLVLSQRPEMGDMSLPGKLTSYYAAGRPIVAAVPLGGSTAAEVERSGAGVVTRSGDSADLLDAAEGMARDPDRGASLAAAGQAYARDRIGKDVILAGLRALIAGENGVRG